MRQNGWKGEFAGEWIHVYMAESLGCSPKTITVLLIGYSPTQNKKLEKKIGDGPNLTPMGHSLLNPVQMIHTHGKISEPLLSEAVTVMTEVVLEGLALHDINPFDVLSTQF